MEMIDFIAYGRLPYYPHMSVADTLIWERYLQEKPAAFDAVAYDVAIGQGAEFDATAGGLLGPGINRLYQRRIDVLAKKGDSLFIIELKPRASTAAIGQVQGYGTIFKRDYPEFKDVQLLIITDSLMPEMQFLAEGAGVGIQIV